MTSSNNLRQENVWMQKIFEVINQEFKPQERRCKAFSASSAGGKGAQSYNLHACTVFALLSLVRQMLKNNNTVCCPSVKAIEANIEPVESRTWK